MIDLIIIFLSYLDVDIKKSWLKMFIIVTGKKILSLTILLIDPIVNHINTSIWNMNSVASQAFKRVQRSVGRTSLGLMS